jgi:hypothetical protein
MSTAAEQATQVIRKIGGTVRTSQALVKDFFDIWVLSANGTFDGPTLAAAAAATFFRRGTAMDTAAVCFTEQYAHHQPKTVQWRAFVRRTEIQAAPASFVAVWDRTMAFLRPVAGAVQENRHFDMVWSPSGPWRPKV